MTHYFLKDGKAEIGPLTIEQLKCRSVNKNTPVWFAGLEEWTTVEQVYELKEIFNPKSSQSRFSNNILVKFWKKLFKKTPQNKSYNIILSKERNNLN
jgi:GYF domain 2